MSKQTTAGSSIVAPGKYKFKMTKLRKNPSRTCKPRTKIPAHIFPKLNPVRNFPPKLTETSPPSGRSRAGATCVTRGSTPGRLTTPRHSSSYATTHRPSRAVEVTTSGGASTRTPPRPTTRSTRCGELPCRRGPTRSSTVSVRVEIFFYFRLGCLLSVFNAYFNFVEPILTSFQFFTIALERCFA